MEDGTLARQRGVRQESGNRGWHGQTCLTVVAPTGLVAQEDTLRLRLGVPPMGPGPALPQSCRAPGNAPAGFRTPLPRKGFRPSGPGVFRFGATGVRVCCARHEGRHARLSVPLVARKSETPEGQPGRTRPERECQGAGLRFAASDACALKFSGIQVTAASPGNRRGRRRSGRPVFVSRASCPRFEGGTPSTRGEPKLESPEICTDTAMLTSNFILQTRCLSG
jgi:hypothetical protein